MRDEGVALAELDMLRTVKEPNARAAVRRRVMAVRLITVRSGWPRGSSVQRMAADGRAAHRAADGDVATSPDDHQLGVPIAQPVTSSTVREMAAPEKSSPVRALTLIARKAVRA